jgi:hypothetical protein
VEHVLGAGVLLWRIAVDVGEDAKGLHSGQESVLRQGAAELLDRLGASAEVAGGVSDGDVGGRMGTAKRDRDEVIEGEVLTWDRLAAEVTDTVVAVIDGLAIDWLNVGSTL